MLNIIQRILPKPNPVGSPLHKTFQSIFKSYLNLNLDQPLPIGHIGSRLLFIAIDSFRFRERETNQPLQYNNNDPPLPLNKTKDFPGNSQ